MSPLIALDNKENFVSSPTTEGKPPMNEDATDSPVILTKVVMANPYASKSLKLSAPPSTIENPYATKTLKRRMDEMQQSEKKFLGGSERARLLARKNAFKRPAKRIAVPGEKENSLDGVLPLRMNSMERFCAALLRSAPIDLFESETSDSKSLVLWKTICQRVGISIPTEPIQSLYEDQRRHFEVRAALVLEEARAVLSQPLACVWRRTDQRNKPMGKCTMVVTAHLSDQRNASSHPSIVFHSRQKFSRDEVFHIRPGSVFQCIPRECPDRSIQNVQLGVVITGNRDQVEMKNMFTCMFFRESDLPPKIENTDWVIAPLCHLISELRAFEAMTVQPGAIPFLTDLLGKPRAQHTRFRGESIDENSTKANRESFDQLDSDDDEPDFHLMEEALRAVNEGARIVQGNEVIVPNDGEEKLSRNPYLPLLLTKQQVTKAPCSLPSNGVFHLTQLNDSQEKAAETFFSSENGTITLVQGPPGTGKTTLLVSVICRYLTNNGSNSGSSRRRLMVCAPTNKAVSVLATRFMASFRENKHGSFSAIIVGDADKLLTDERSLGNSSDKGCKTQAGNLKSIFLYTWMQTLVEDYRTIKSCFLPGYKGGNSLENLCSLSAKLERRLSNSLPNLCTKIHKAAEEISAILRKLKPGTGGHDIVTKLEKLIKDLAAIPNDIVWSQVLSFADVIFCTLSSAGGAALKRTGQIDDLIIDEAAAATEPEICVPFHLKPNRLFAVGDPLQLPATVLSQRATQLGLTKSLHERLMYECNFGHVMLKVQYRMNPEISKFPSMRFYKSEIANGDNVMNSKYQMGPKLLNRLPYTFLQVSGLEEQGATGSYHNRAEATKVVELVSDLRRMTASTNPLWHSSERVRVITFYQSQVSLIKRLLINKGFGDKIVVATVDSSQGCEADIVIISFVRSQRDDCKSHSVGFLADNRRMNVALTRAKYQLICIGNICSFAKMYGAQTMQMLAANADERRLVQPALQVVACSRENRG